MSVKDCEKNFTGFTGLSTDLFTVRTNEITKMLVCEQNQFAIDNL